MNRGWLKKKPMLRCTFMCAEYWHKVKFWTKFSKKNVLPISPRPAKALVWNWPAKYLLSHSINTSIFIAIRFPDILTHIEYPWFLLSMLHFLPCVCKRDTPKCILPVFAGCRKYEKCGYFDHFWKWPFLPNINTSQICSPKGEQNTAVVKYIRVKYTLVQEFSSTIDSTRVVF